MHAIGKGILIAEVQQNSNTTYRVSDYGRLGADGKPRELHIKKAAEALKHFTEEEIKRERFCKSVFERDRNCLCDNEYFTVHRFKETPFSLNYDDDEFIFLKNLAMQIVQTEQDDSYKLVMLNSFVYSFVV